MRSTGLLKLLFFLSHLLFSYSLLYPVCHIYLFRASFLASLPCIGVLEVAGEEGAVAGGASVASSQSRSLRYAARWALSVSRGGCPARYLALSTIRV